MHRMQQQVQRAVEAAKAKPKNNQLVIEGSLGKISISNSKTPRPMLNIKRNDNVTQVTLNSTDRKAILKNIEAVYGSLMSMEDHDRRIPPRPLDDQDQANVDTWQAVFKQLNAQLWSELRVTEPIMPDSTAMQAGYPSNIHPFDCRAATDSANPDHVPNRYA